MSAVGPARMGAGAGPATVPWSLVDVVRASVVLVLAVVLQQAVVDAVRLHGAHADVLVLVALAAGLVAGPDRGAGVGFAVGIVADLFLPTPFGLSVLVDCLAGYGAGLVGTALAGAGLQGSPWWPAPAVLGLGAGAATTGYAVLIALLGAPRILPAYLPAAAVMTAAGGVVLGPLAMVVTRWAVPPSVPASSASIGAGGSATVARTRARAE